MTSSQTHCHETPPEDEEEGGEGDWLGYDLVLTMAGGSRAASSSIQSKCEVSQRGRPRKKLPTKGRPHQPSHGIGPTDSSISFCPHNMVIGWLISLFLVFASLPRWVHATTWQKNFPNLHDINEWHYPDLEEQANTDFEPKRRVWDRAMLKSATSNANYAALKPLIERLERGERVVVAALGSSQVADFAGCWGNISLVKETVEVLHSTYGAHKCGAPVSKFDSDGSRTHKLPGFMPGWGHGLMLFINKTWPNPRHVFVNIGSGGYTFYSYADQGCLDSHIPRRLDLLILEQNERGGANAVQLKQAESFMWRLARHFTGSSISPVPIVMVSTIAVAQPYSPHSECMAHGKCTGCSVEYQHSIKPSLVGQCMEDQYLPLLKHFGFSSFSLRNFYLHVLSSGALAKNGNLTACQFLGKLHIDVMHLDALGQILISDILVNYFVESIDYLKVENKDSLGTWRLPETTFSPSVTISVSRCYGKQLTYEHLLHGGESKSEETAKFAAISSGSDSGSIDLKVKSNQGWKWIEVRFLS